MHIKYRQAEWRTSERAHGQREAHAARDARADRHPALALVPSTNCRSSWTAAGCVAPRARRKRGATRRDGPARELPGLAGPPSCRTHRGSGRASKHGPAARAALAQMRGAWPVAPPSLLLCLCPLPQSLASIRRPPCRTMPGHACFPSSPANSPLANIPQATASRSLALPGHGPRHDRTDLKTDVGGWVSHCMPHRA